MTKCYPNLVFTLRHQTDWLRKKRENNLRRTCFIFIRFNQRNGGVVVDTEHARTAWQSFFLSCNWRVPFFFLRIMHYLMRVSSSASYFFAESNGECGWEHSCYVSMQVWQIDCFFVFCTNTCSVCCNECECCWICQVILLVYGGTHGHLMGTNIRVLTCFIANMCSMENFRAPLLWTWANPFSGIVPVFIQLFVCSFVYLFVFPQGYVRVSTRVKCEKEKERE